MEKEKSMKEQFAQGIIFLIFVLLALGCGNMSEQDAYDIGYGAGRAGRLLYDSTK